VAPEGDRNESGIGLAGVVVYRICRGAAVAVLALAVYVALTNWEGSGSVWSVRYAAIALAVYGVGVTVRAVLRRR
jgi:hypothetical protein